MPTCEEYVGLYIADFAHGHKQSSVDAQVSRLRRFREDFGGRSLDLTRVELKEWMRGEGRWAGRAPIAYTSMSAVISLYYHAIDESELPLERNPASKLSKRVPRSAEELTAHAAGVRSAGRSLLDAGLLRQDDEGATPLRGLRADAAQ